MKDTKPDYGYIAIKPFIIIGFIGINMLQKYNNLFINIFLTEN
jgi:hypothetical protein